jgi:hypothetical protein
VALNHRSWASGIRKVRIGIMCIDLAIRYECGHKIVSNFPCSSKKSKAIDKYEEEKARRCRVCHRGETAKISKERDDALQKTLALENRLDAALRECGAAEQRYRYAEQGRKDGRERIKTLERALEETTGWIPAHSDMCTKIALTFACKHTTTKQWCPKKVESEDCPYQQRLRSGIEEGCMKCRQQEATTRDNDIVRLQSRCLTEECRIKEVQDRVRSLEEMLLQPKVDLSIAIKGAQLSRNASKENNFEHVTLAKDRGIKAVQTDAQLKNAKDGHGETVLLELAAASWNQDAM